MSHLRGQADGAVMGAPQLSLRQGACLSSCRQCCGQTGCCCESFRNCFPRGPWPHLGELVHVGHWFPSLMSMARRLLTHQVRARLGLDPCHRLGAQGPSQSHGTCPGWSGRWTVAQRVGAGGGGVGGGLWVGRFALGGMLPAVHCLRAQLPGRGGPCGVTEAPDVEQAEQRVRVGAPVDRGGWRAAVLVTAKSRTGQSTHTRTCKPNQQVRPGKPVGRRGTIATRREPALTPPSVFHLQPPRTAHRLREYCRWARVPQGDCPPPCCRLAPLHTCSPSASTGCASALKPPAR